MQFSMRLLSREALASKSLYVCSTCRQEVAPQGLAPLARPFRRYASNESFLERTRKKLWGTEKPPGLDDPYGGEGKIAQAWRRRKEQREAASASEETDLAESDVAEEAEAERDLLPSDKYKQALNWQGLGSLGYLKKDAWKQIAPTEVDEVQRFAPDPVNSTPKEIVQQVYRVAMEICIMHMVEKEEQVANICDVEVHETIIQTYLDSCYLHPSADGSWKTAVRFPNKKVKDVLFYVFNQTGGEEEPALNTEKFASNVGMLKEQPVLTNLVLSDPRVKFIFFKRLTQLTGHHFSDKSINTLTTVGHAVEHLQKWAESLSPKARKLWFDDVTLPSNISFKPRKEKRSDRDEDFGRKKLYMTELYNRGLYQVPDSLIPPRKRPASH